ncbi:hypothetical protein EVAR_18078_1 [Eumeta japonica]|uniref:Uncharacterized protein n=1 Tax=Eumeta variegata TaxID=151549 RepID=A0A4C1VHZ1_EUMVA|nr:hypothetical protein EVAR_18078_1 [Eumeta japonica]
MLQAIYFLHNFRAITSAPIALHHRQKRPRYAPSRPAAGLLFMARLMAVRWRPDAGRVKSFYCISAVSFCCGRAALWPARSLHANVSARPAQCHSLTENMSELTDSVLITAGTRGGHPVSDRSCVVEVAFAGRASACAGADHAYPQANDLHVKQFIHT